MKYRELQVLAILSTLEFTSSMLSMEIHVKTHEAQDEDAWLNWYLYGGTGGLIILAGASWCFIRR